MGVRLPHNDKSSSILHKLEIVHNNIWSKSFVNKQMSLCLAETNTCAVKSDTIWNENIHNMWQASLHATGVVVLYLCWQSTDDVGVMFVSTNQHACSVVHHITDTTRFLVRFTNFRHIMWPTILIYIYVCIYIKMKWGNNYV